MDQSPAFTPAAPLDDDGELTRLHPNYATVIRLTTALNCLPFVIAAGVFELVWNDKGLWPTGVLIGVVLLIAIALIIRIPARRYSARGYQISADRLRVVRGILFRSDTVVPFSRVQHIDVAQGPIERFFGIATLTLHTAGNHNASVNLPGLGEPLARDMREQIRAHIRRESM
jgi:membrane protein YdbS with pleckstrin-like domain